MNRENTCISCTGRGQVVINAPEPKVGWEWQERVFCLNCMERIAKFYEMLKANDFKGYDR